MGRFSFRKRSTEEEGLPEEESTGAHEESGGQTGGVRRILVIAGIGVILIGGWYVAQPLFFSPPPSPPSGPTRPITLVPPTKVPGPIAPTKEAAPVPAAPPAKEEANPTPSAPPVKAAAPAAPSKDASPRKATVAPPAPTKSEASKPASPEKASLLAQTEGKSAPKDVSANFSLQIGAMVMVENAEALRRKLDASGFPAVIRKGSAYVSKQIITVGEPTGKLEAEDLSRRLNVDGFPSQLLVVGNKYTPQIAAVYSENEAIDLARELQKKNYSPKIIYKPVTTVVYQVRHGKFDSRLAAVRRGEELKSKGFSFLVVRD
jgi:cell division septation protein DedD